MTQVNRLHQTLVVLFVVGGGVRWRDNPREEWLPIVLAPCVGETTVPQGCWDEGIQEGLFRRASELPRRAPCGRAFGSGFEGGIICGSGGKNVRGESPLCIAGMQPFLL